MESAQELLSCLGRLRNRKPLHNSLHHTRRTETEKHFHLHTVHCREQTLSRHVKTGELQVIEALQHIVIRYAAILHNPNNLSTAIQCQMNAKTHGLTCTATSMGLRRKSNTVSAPSFIPAVIRSASTGSAVPKPENHRYVILLVGKDCSIGDGVREQGVGFERETLPSWD